MNRHAKDTGALNFSSFSLYRNAVYGVAAIWIVLFHGIQMGRVHFGPELQWLRDIYWMGNAGVDIFILLSGIGLYFSLSKKPNLGRFYYKRLVRIYLPYLIIVVPYIAVRTLIMNYDLGRFFRAAFAVNFWIGENDPVDFWYISTILALYLLYPLIHWFIHHREKGSLIRTIVLAAVTVAVTITLFFLAPDVYHILDRALPRLTLFIVGCYMGKVVKEKRRLPVWLIIVSAAVLIVGAFIYGGDVLMGLPYRYYGVLIGFAATVVFSQLFVLLAKIRLDKVFAFFGTISLEIYLASIIGRKLFWETPYYAEPHAFANYMVAMVIAIAVAYLVNLVQKPLLRLLKV